MNKGFLNLKKFSANAVSSVIFWSREQRRAFRDRIWPTRPKRCVKYLSKYTKNIVYKEVAAAGDGKYLWTCWLQGEDNAPDLVKKCFRSMRQYMPSDFEMVVITLDNLDKYLTLPDFVIKKYKAKIISNPHFSDIIRLSLLKKYGGFWIDATCLLTAPLPSKIYNSEFFIYRSFGKFSKTFINNCFIYSKPYNHIIVKWLAAVVKYWAAEKFTLEYFLHHYLFIALLERDNDFKQCYDRYSLDETDENMHIIFRFAENNGPEISEDFYKTACEKSFIHKLTYKFDIRLPENQLPS